MARLESIMQPRIEAGAHHSDEIPAPPAV